MSNFIIRQEGPSSVVADNIWEMRLGAVSFLVGALTSALAIAAVGRYLGRRKPGSGVTPQDWPVNFAHRGSAKIAPEKNCP